MWTKKYPNGTQLKFNLEAGKCTLIKRMLLISIYLHNIPWLVTCYSAANIHKHENAFAVTFQVEERTRGKVVTSILYRVQILSVNTVTENFQFPLFKMKLSWSRILFFFLINFSAVSIESELIFQWLHLRMNLSLLRLLTVKCYQASSGY